MVRLQLTTAKIVRVILALIFLLHTACTQRVTSNSNASTDTAIKSYSEVLRSLEEATSVKHNAYTEELVKTISFSVKTNDVQNFENGIMTYIPIEKSEDYLSKLINKNEKVITEPKVIVVIDYPLTTEYSFVLESKNGFTRTDLVNAINKNYYKIYEEEETTAKIKTIPIDERKTMYNRNQTDGKYGIWGHDIHDLILTEVLVYRTKEGEIILRLGIES